MPSNILTSRPGIIYVVTGSPNLSAVFTPFPTPGNYQSAL